MDSPWLERQSQRLYYPSNFIRRLSTFWIIYSCNSTPQKNHTPVVVGSCGVRKSYFIFLATPVTLTPRAGKAGGLSRMIGLDSRKPQLKALSERLRSYYFKYYSAPTSSSFLLWFVGYVLAVWPILWPVEYPWLPEHQLIEPCYGVWVKSGGRLRFLVPLQRLLHRGNLYDILNIWQRPNHLWATCRWQAGSKRSKASGTARPRTNFERNIFHVMIIARERAHRAHFKLLPDIPSS